MAKFTEIEIHIDQREWNYRLQTTDIKVIRATVDDILDRYPTYSNRMVAVNQTSNFREALTPVADGWLAVHPTIRLALLALSVAMLVAGLML